MVLKVPFIAVPGYSVTSNSNDLIAVKEGLLASLYFYSFKIKSTPGHGSWFCSIGTSVASAWLKSPVKRHVLFLAHRHRCINPKIAVESTLSQKGLSLHRETQNPESLILIQLSTSPALLKARCMCTTEKGLKQERLLGLSF